MMRRFHLLLLVGMLACEGKAPTPDPALPDPPCGIRDGMVGLKRLDTGACFWMDARPVSQREFLDAVEAGMPLADDNACAAHAHAPQFRASRTDFCKGIDNINPSQLQAGVQYLRWPPGGNTGHLPLKCAHWCDAKAYCEYVGKRLCDAADVGTFSANAARADEVHSACATDVAPVGNALGRTCDCWGEGPDECYRDNGWHCTLNQCEGPYAGMQCMMSSHIFVQSDRPAMQSMGWDGAALDCTLGTVATEGAMPSDGVLLRDLDDAVIVCCAD